LDVSGDAGVEVGHGGADPDVAQDLRQARHHRRQLREGAARPAHHVEQLHGGQQPVAGGGEVGEDDVPDCSPPIEYPPERSASSTHRSPTGVSTTVIPRACIASRNPRLLITVTTTASRRSVPRSCRSTAQIAMIWSPSTSSPAASTATSRSASPSNASPTSAPCSTTACCKPAGWVDPHPSLMLVPFGSACSTVTVAPSRRSTSGAIVLAAPFAQSTTRRRPLRSRPAMEATIPSAYPPSGSASASTVPIASPVGDCSASIRSPAACPCTSASSVASSTASTSSSSLRPSGVNNLIPLSG